MTREEAIEILKAHHMWTGESQEIIDVRKENKALEMAIQALSQEPTSEMVHVETLHQVMWERDIAIEQLKELGYSFGQKIEPCDDAISRIFQRMWNCRGKHTTSIDKVAMEQIIRDELSVTQKSGKCKNCKYFEYDSVAKVDGIPLIVAHEICNKWGDGCKTSEDGYCYLFEPQERSDKE